MVGMPGRSPSGMLTYETQAGSGTVEVACAAMKMAKVNIVRGWPCEYTVRGLINERIKDNASGAKEYPGGEDKSAVLCVSTSTVVQTRINNVDHKR